jgi:hypothetical protein
VIGLLKILAMWMAAYLVAILLLALQQNDFDTDAVRTAVSARSL